LRKQVRVRIANALNIWRLGGREIQPKIAEAIGGTSNIFEI